MKKKVNLGFSVYIEGLFSGFSINFMFNTTVLCFIVLLKHKKLLKISSIKVNLKQMTGKKTIYNRITFGNVSSNWL